ncbi:10638_t:CDS:2 [Funneliformis geosporum]|uniref:10638_t:CDS:1 n=1 Tax=Funneliformis geosporum TaxID=1117311 RepID=A0A9W4SHT2_9GLOM|nr:10638_t:CDS:2 [Funneliformis geosporum]
MTDRLVICIDKLNNKLKDLLEENKRLKQQHENLQEENRETLHINSEQKEMLQERDKQFEKLNENSIFKEYNKSFIIESSEQKYNTNKEAFKIPLSDIENSSENSWNLYNKDNIRIMVGLEFGTKYSSFSYCHVKSKTLAKTSSRKSGIGEFKPFLPVDYKKAITDYLGEIGKNHIIFFENVLLIISCPAKYSDKTKVIMRECAFNAGLINDNNSITLQFISGAEASALFCINREHDL